MTTKLSYNFLKNDPAFSFDLSELKSFETKTSPIYMIDVSTGEILDKELTPQQFTLILYTRSQENSSTEIDQKGNEYFSSLLADTSDVIEMKKLPFNEWYKFIETNGYAHIKKESVMRMFDRLNDAFKQHLQKEGKNV